MFIEKSMDWFEEQNLLDPDLIQFEEVRFASGDVVVKAGSLPGGCLVVEGNLSVQGQLFVDEQDAIFVNGVVKCDSFGIYASPFNADALEVEDSIYFGESYDQMFETWECTKVKARVVLAMDTDEDEIPEGVFLHRVDEPEEYGGVLESMFEDSFDEIFKALEDGIEIDDVGFGQPRTL